MEEIKEIRDLLVEIRDLLKDQKKRADEAIAAAEKSRENLDGMLKSFCSIQHNKLRNQS